MLLKLEKFTKIKGKVPSNQKVLSSFLKQISDSNKKSTAGSIEYNFDDIGCLMLATSDNKTVGSPLGVYLLLLEVIPEARGVGNGQLLLELLLLGADSFDVPIVLTPKKLEESIKKKQLVNWYKKNGFVRLDENDLIRYPGFRG